MRGPGWSEGLDGAWVEKRKEEVFRGMMVWWSLWPVVWCRACGRTKLRHLFCCAEGDRLKGLHPERRWKSLLSAIATAPARRLKPNLLAPTPSSVFQ